MADGVVSQKFTGNSTDAQNAIAVLEKKFEDMNRKIAEGGSAAKKAAEERRQAEKDANRDAADSRKVYRQTIKQLEKDERDADQQRRRQLSDDMKESRSVFRNTVRQLQEQEREEKRSAQERTRNEKRESLERRRAAREEAREKKRIALDEDRARGQLTSWIGSVTTLVAGYLGVSNALQTILNLQQEIQRNANEAGVKQDKLLRNFALQANLSEEQAAIAQDSINKEAFAAAVTTEKAGAAATQLVSSGFSPEEAMGPSLRALLKAQAASGDIEGDSGDFALSVSQLMSAAGLEKTAPNLERVGRSIASLKQLGNLKADDIQFIAPKMQGFISQGGSLEEGMAAFVTMEEATNRENAATGTKIMWERLMGAKGRKLEKQLNAIGVKPEEVDFVGENQLQVLERLKGAFDAEKKRTGNAQPAMQSIFGESATHVQGLLNKIDRYKEFVDGQKDTEFYDNAAKTMQTGKGALQTRNVVAREMQLSPMQTDTDEILTVAEEMARAKGQSEWSIWANGMMAGTGRYMFGAKPENSLSMYFPDEQDQFDVLLETAKRKGGALTGVSPETNKLLIEALRKNSEVTEKANKLAEEQLKNKNQTPPPVKRPVPPAPDRE